MLLGEASTVLSVDDAFVSSWDLAGRPYALVRETGTYRRGLGGGLLHKREATAASPRLRERLSALQGAPIVGAARDEARAAIEALERLETPARVTLAQTSTEARVLRPADLISAAVARLRVIAAMDAAALAGDAERFLAACGPVGILPPDQYLSLVVRLTEGCSWNACTFCGLYRDVPFRVRTPSQLQQQIAELTALFGPSIALRRSVFLGDANALALGSHRLLPLLDTVAEALPGRPLFSFVDAWTGRRMTSRDWRACAERGLRRVYVGLETGDPALLSWLGKPNTPADAVDLVRALHAAGVAVGVIVLVGVGGERFANAHVAGSVATLTAMRLGPDDLVYFSEYLDDPALAYGRRTAGAPDLEPLPPDGSADQRAAIAAGFEPATPGRPPRVASYDIREFVY